MTMRSAIAMTQVDFWRCFIRWLRVQRAISSRAIRRNFHIRMLPLQSQTAISREACTGCKQRDSCGSVRFNHKQQRTFKSVRQKQTGQRPVYVRQLTLRHPTEQITPKKSRARGYLTHGTGRIHI